MGRAVSFLESAVAFDAYRFTLKSVPCPHCRGMGHLIRHGFLRGYAEEGSERVVRGWRIYCSDRGRRRGCGRTHSVLLADMLRHRTVRAQRLWKFLAAWIEGMSIKAAWEKVAARFDLDCGDRLMRTLRRFQTHLRARLCREEPPGPCLHRDALAQTLEHLRSIFPSEDCPIAAFQLHFQRPFLG